MPTSGFSPDSNSDEEIFLNELAQELASFLKNRGLADCEMILKLNASTATPRTATVTIEQTVMEDDETPHHLGLVGGCYAVLSTDEGTSNDE